MLVTASSGLALLAVLIALVATTLFTGMVVELVADVQDGRRDATVGQLLRAVTPVLGQLILVGIVAGVGIVIGFVLIIVPGLILITIWSVAAPVVVLERPARPGALRRSRELVRGNGWQVFGVIFVLGILVVVVLADGDRGCRRLGGDRRGHRRNGDRPDPDGSPGSAGGFGALLRASRPRAGRRTSSRAPRWAARASADASPSWRPRRRLMASAGHPAEDPAGDVKGLAVHVVRPG